MTEEITNATDNKKASIVVFKDLKKAFDTVNHNLLIQKLEINVLKRLVSYLTKRTQSVYTDDVKSDIIEVVCGMHKVQYLDQNYFLYI